MSWGPHTRGGIERGARGAGRAGDARDAAVASAGRRSRHPRLLVAVLAALVAFGAWGVLTARAQSGAPISATEGEQFSEVVATVSLPGCLPGSASGVATVVWGDGTGASPGQVTQVSSTELAVIASHTYAEEGSDGGTVSGKWQCTPTNPSSGAISGPIDASFDAQVMDASLSASGQPVTATAGQVFAATVATFTDGDPGGAAADYSASIDWGDGSSSPADGRKVTVSSGSQGFVVSGTHVYPDGGSYPLTVTISDAGGYQTTAHGTATVGIATAVPSSVDFTVSPAAVPELSHHAITFSVVSPVPGVAYEWDFGDEINDPANGFVGDQFYVWASGATVTHTYADPPAAANGVQQATYNVRLRAVLSPGAIGKPGPVTWISSAQHQLTVVPDTASGAQFLALHLSNGQLSSSTAVTHPVTFVPQAQLPQATGDPRNQIVREDWWFDTGNGPPNPPDLTCLSTGQCGHYIGPSPEPLVPDPSQLQPVQGIQDLGTGAVQLEAAHCLYKGYRRFCSQAQVASPTAGFEAFSVNFFDRQLGEIGAASGYPTLPPTNYRPPQTGYPPLSSVDLSQVTGTFWPDYPGPGPARDRATAARWPRARPAAIVPGAVGAAVRQEYLWDFLYNYSAAIEADYDVNGTAAGVQESTKPGAGYTCLPLVPSGPGGTGPGGTGPGGTEPGGTGPGGHGNPTSVAVDARALCQRNLNQVVTPRSVTMVAYDSGGKASDPATRPVLLTPVAGPNFDLQLKVNGQPVALGGSTSVPIYQGNSVQFQPTGTGGGDDPMDYWAVEVGQPRDVALINGRSCATEVPGPRNAEVRFGNDLVVALPNFSDLLAGVSPFHDCQGYADRTVDPALAPEPIPPSQVQTAGPSRDRRGHASRVLRLGSVPGGVRLTRLGGCTSVADPALVTQDPNSLCFKFDQPGIYSVAVAGYDTEGLGAITRVDGFLVLPTTKAGACQVIASGQFNMNGQTYGWSGSCVGIHPEGGNAVYVSHAPIDIDGITLAPAPGDDIVIDNSESPGGAQVFTVARGACDWKSGGGCQRPGPQAGGAVYLQFGQDQVGYLPDFNAGEASQFLRPHSTSDPADGCGVKGEADEWQWQLPPATTYRGFTVSTPPCVIFRPGATSRADFDIQLPGEISAPSDTHVTLQGEDIPPTSVLSSNSYAGVARARAPKRVIAGAIGRGPRARVADDTVPTCPDNSTSSQAVVPGGTTIGPITIPGALKLCYVSQTGDFIGDVNVSLPFPLGATTPNITFGIELGDGQVKRAGGEAQGDVPIVTGVDLTRLGFGVQFDPTELAGTVAVSAAQIFNLNGTVDVTPSPLDVKASGTLTFAPFNLQLAQAQAEYNNASQTLTFGVNIGNDFGPVSLTAALNGGVDFNTTSWYILGNGNACLGVCLGVQALAAHDATKSTTTLAACGDINVFGIEVGAGFNIVVPGGAEIFTGCDLSPYIPAEFNKGGAADAAPLGPGQSQTLTLCPTTPAPGQPACGPQNNVSAVQVYSSAASVPGQEPQAPLVELDGPGGRVITPTPTPGGQMVPEDNNTAAVTEDPVPSVNPLDPAEGVRTTTILIDNPGSASQWTLKVLPGSPAVIGTAVSYLQPPVDAPMFSGHVQHALITPQRGGLLLRIGDRRFTAGVAHGASAAYAEPILAPSIEDLAQSGSVAVAARARSPLARLSLPTIDAHRLRGVVFEAPKRLGADPVTLIDQGPGGTQILADGLLARRIPRGGLPIAFLPTDDPGTTHEIKAIILNPDGALRKVLTLSTYRSPALPRPERPRIDRTVRQGDQLELFFSPGDTPILPHEPTISLTLRTSFGERLSLMFAKGQVRPIGPLHGIGADRQASEYELVIPGIDPTASVRLSLAGAFEGRGSLPVGSLVRREVAGINERRLMNLARHRRCPRRGPCRPVIP